LTLISINPFILMRLWACFVRI